MASNANESRPVIIRWLIVVIAGKKGILINNVRAVAIPMLKATGTLSISNTKKVRNRMRILTNSGFIGDILLRFNLAHVVSCVYDDQDSTQWQYAVYISQRNLQCW